MKTIMEYEMCNQQVLLKDRRHVEFLAVCYGQSFYNKKKIKPPYAAHKYGFMWKEKGY